ncbi:T9SS type A sorting domain-containing protein [Fluviicola taffensis]|uniref:T9SS type A sorting domain-containing protein n=1 Tax=Fluviicola taffensis TaxID=191579 RepID=UPI00030153A2|nr:T9SS type A sorting domain-containing protein [Fluviicola taffensis]
MKQLIIIAAILSSLNVFSQEKGMGNRSNVKFDHYIFDSLGYTGFSDYFYYSDIDQNSIGFSGSFKMNSLDTVFYEITLSTGDSLVYTGEWFSPYPPYFVSSLVNLDSVITVLSGIQFPISTNSGYDSYFNSGFMQRGVIHNSCLLEISSAHIPDADKYYVRINFVDPPLNVIDLPINLSDIKIYQKDELSLFIEVEDNAQLNVKFLALSGQLISETTLEGSNNLNISSFSQGYYIIQVKDSNGAEKQLKFIR